MTDSAAGVLMEIGSRETGARARGPFRLAAVWNRLERPTCSRRREIRLCRLPGYLTETRDGNRRHID